MNIRRFWSATLALTALHLDPRVADDDVLVAGAAVDLADLVEVFLELGRVVEVLLADPGDEGALLGVLHRPAQARVVEHRVALELDVRDADAVPLVDLEDHLLLVGADVLDRVLGGREAVPLLAVHLLDQPLDPLQLAERQRLPLVNADPLGGQLVLEVGLRDPLQPLVVDRAQDRALHHGDHQADTGRRGHALHLDVVDQVALPELLDVLVEGLLVQRLARREAEVVAQSLLGEPLEALELDPLDGATVRRRLGERLGTSRAHTAGKQQREQRRRHQAAHGPPPARPAPAHDDIRHHLVLS